MKILYGAIGLLFCFFSCKTNTPEKKHEILIVQEENSIYKAKFVLGNRSMQIGQKTYNIYLESDPIAPTRGERILDMGGVLDYYMWIYKGNDDYMTIGIIDKNLNVYYYNNKTENFENKPNNTKIDLKNGKIEFIE